MLNQKDTYKKISGDERLQRILCAIHLEWILFFKYSKSNLNTLQRVNKTLIDYPVKVIQLNQEIKTINIIIECKRGKYVELVINEKNEISTNFSILYNKPKFWGLI